MTFSLKKIITTTALLILAMQLFAQTFSIRFGRDESLGYAVNCRSSDIYEDTIYTLLSENRDGGWFPTIYKLDIEGNVLDTFIVGEGNFSMNGGWADNLFAKEQGIFFCGSKTTNQGDARLARINHLNHQGEEIWEKVFGDSIHNYIFI